MYEKIFRKIITVFSVLFLTLFYALCPSPYAVIHAAVPHLINYQGKLTDSSGVPLTGSYNITFKIYNAETAGTLLWQETQTGVVVQKGVFSILLGSVTALNLPFDAQYYLAIQVGADSEMSPRQRITSAGYAIRAEESEKLGGKQSSEYALATDITVTPTANKAVKLDANAKLPLSALKVYDSGWFFLSTDTESNRTKLLTHNLGTTVFIPLIYCSATADGSNAYLQPLTGTKTNPDNNSQAYGISFEGISTTQVRVRIGNQYNGVYIKPDGEPGNIAYGADQGSYSIAYWRVVLIAIE